MLEQDERIAKFLDAIDRDAQERRRQIEAQVDQANAEALERAKAEAQAKQLMRKELSKQRVAVNQKFAKEAASLRTALAGRRTEIADQVFLEAEQSLRAFTEKPEYQAFLSGSAARCAALLPQGESAVLLVREADIPLADALRAAFGRPCEVRADASIRIGGLKASCEAKGLGRYVG